MVGKGDYSCGPGSLPFTDAECRRVPVLLLSLGSESWIRGANEDRGISPKRGSQSMYACGCGSSRRRSGLLSGTRVLEHKIIPLWYLFRFFLPVPSRPTPSPLERVDTRLSSATVSRDLPCRFPVPVKTRLSSPVRDSDHSRLRGFPCTGFSPPPSLRQSPRNLSEFTPSLR